VVLSFVHVGKENRWKVSAYDVVCDAGGEKTLRPSVFMFRGFLLNTA
jgi:hypothetical protein